MDPDGTSPATPGARPPVSRLAVAAAICGLLLPPAGVVLGLLALAWILASGGRRRGMPHAAVGILVGALILAIVVPGLLRSRIGSGESSPLSCLKGIATGEEQFRNACCVDLDGDKDGEYGFLSELGGTRPCRGSGQQYTRTPFIPRVLGTLDANGVALKSGYCFKVYLPSGPAAAVSEDANGPPKADPAAAPLQGRRYVAYAWPQIVGRTGLRFFMIDEQGRPFTWKGDSPYSGADRAPPWDAALADTNGNGKKDWEDGVDEARWAPTG
jgi:hypothetical protein